MSVGNNQLQKKNILIQNSNTLRLIISQNADNEIVRSLGLGIELSCSIYREDFYNLHFPRKRNLP
jgi:hypothetical protein